MLADLVAQGTLPPVEERLPREPVVVTPTNQVGTYGGTFRSTALAPETVSDFQVAGVVGLFRFSNDLSEAYPEVATGYEFNADNTSCTITLREGIRWSDGQPFTADDVIFFFEDYQLDPDVTPVPASHWRPGGEVLTITKVDDYTIKFDFARPNPAFALIHYAGAPIAAFRPKHHLQKFHLKYNPQADEEARAAGFDNWQALFIRKATMGYGVQEPDVPVIDPWMPVKNDSQRQEWERNPYYFAVDTEGNQLPYIDRAIVEYSNNLEVANLKAVSGELSAAGLDLLLINYPVLRDGAESGDYRMVLVKSERGSDVALALNTEHQDPVLKQIFNDVRFRQALSLAIDRNEINELVFLGQGTVRQATINESASIFKQEWADNFAAFDPDEANRLLDEVGLDQRGSDGVRLRPDGQPMAFQLEYLPNEGPKKEVCELCVKYWSDVGLKVEAQGRDRAFLLTRLNASEQDMSGWHVDRQLERAAYAYGATQKLGPGGDSAILFAKPWKDWLSSGGASGTEPPAEAKELFEAYAAWQQTTIGTPEYAEAGTRVYDLIAQNLWVIGTIGHAPQPVLIKNNLENVFAADVLSGDRQLWWGAANWFWHTLRPDQWYFKA